MAFYEVNLGILVLLNGFIFYRQRSAASSKSHQNKLKSIESGSDRDGAAVRDFVKIYLVGHLLAFAGDWLQVSFTIRRPLFVFWMFLCTQAHCTKQLKANKKKNSNTKQNKT